MTGNVWEWVEDGYDASFYQRPAGRDPVRSMDGVLERGVRGGSWSYPPDGHKTDAWYRDHGVPLERQDDLGFRVARSPW
jgi:formylglycine-generating enzyme required for sulfatase activity